MLLTAAYAGKELTLTRESDRLEAVAVVKQFIDWIIRKILQWAPESLEWVRK